jgi:hypothetical protein
MTRPDDGTAGRPETAGHGAVGSAASGDVAGETPEAAGGTSDTAAGGVSMDDAPRPAPGKETLLAQMGGPVGMLDSGLPVVVFVVVNVVAGLTAGIVAALSAGIVIAIVRLIRHKPVSQALGGLVAVGIAAYIAHRVGSARGYFLFGIWTYLLYGGGLLLSVIVRWPLIGLAWESLNGRGVAWRANRALRHRYDAATLVWVAVFALRYAVQQWLYGADQVGWLAAARLAMGYPLFIVAIALTVAIVGASSGLRLRDLVRRRS